MITFVLNVNETCAVAKPSGPVTAGLVGSICRGEFSDAWDGLSRTLCIRCGPVERTVPFGPDDTAEIPPECFQEGYRLELAADGTDADGNVRIPSVFYNCGIVRRSPAGILSLDTTPNLAKQILQIVEDAERKASDAQAKSTQVKEDADSGKLQGKNGRSPYIGPDTGTWFFYNDATQRFEDSGVVAGGPTAFESLVNLVMDNKLSLKNLQLWAQSLIWLEESAIRVPTEEDIGQLEELGTEDKSNLVAAINEIAASLSRSIGIHDLSQATRYEFAEMSDLAPMLNTAKSPAEPGKIWTATEHGAEWAALPDDDSVGGAELDATLSDPNKAAPASVVGEIKDDLGGCKFAVIDGILTITYDDGSD